MGKAKRNMRQDVTLPDSASEGEEEEVIPVPAAKPTKKKSKAAARFAALDLPSSDDTEASSEDETKPTPKAKGKKKKINAFELLGGDSDGDSEVSGKMGALELGETAEPAAAQVVDPFAEGSGEETKLTKKKGGKKQAAVVDADGQADGGTVKTKKQKAAEKKERDRKKREADKAKKSKENDEFAAALAEFGVEKADDYVEPETKNKKKKKKKEAAPKEEEEEEEEIPAAEPPAVVVQASEVVAEEAAPAAQPEAAPAAQPETVGGTEAPKEAAIAEAAVDEEAEEGAEEGAASKKKKKKKKKGAAAVVEEKKPKQTAHGKKIKELQELMKAKEEELKKQQEEEEKEEERKEDERLEKIRLEEERKQRKKEKEKERKERKKKEGTWLSKAEKEKQAKNQAALEAMKQQGLLVPGVDREVPKPAAGKIKYGGRQRKKKPQLQEDQIADAMAEKTAAAEAAKEQLEKVGPAESWELLDPKTESVTEAWDASDDDKDAEALPADKKPKGDGGKVEAEEESEEEEEEEGDEDEEEEEESEDESSEGEEESSDEELDVRDRMKKRKAHAERMKDPNVLRAPILCVLGHVDTGKTTILDKFRRTNVQEGEAGGITQQIGATNVPIENIRKECAHLNGPEMKIPGMLIIDTPGHESFSNLRSRGSSLCDLAILVVDIMHGLEQQTIESLNLLKKRKTPFVIALNKIDRLYEWKTMPQTPVKDVIKAQKKITRDAFADKCSQALVQIAEQGLNAKLFYENPDEKTYISVVPVSGISGDGMADLLSLACDLSQRMLGAQLVYTDYLEAMVMEVKTIHGLGTTVDIILRNGSISEGDTVVLSGIDGAFSTTVRAVLTPHPMKEMRVKNNYIQHKIVRAAQGIKICARDMEKTLAGMPVYVSKRSDETLVLVADANKALKQELSSIRVSPEGVYVQASTLGSLEALLQFLKDSKIKYSGVSIGPVHKKDIMKASVMLQHDKEFACLLAFDVKVERDAQEIADSLGVRIFTADIIYHLFDQFMAYKDELKNKRKEEFKNSAVFPSRLRILPTCIFNTRDPIVIGVTVINGILKTGTPICVPSKEFIYLGVVTSLEMNNKQIDSAQTGQDICIKIEHAGGDAPKLYGRHFDENDVLVSRITRDSIDILKEYFRDDMSKENWKLIVELKKIFGII